MRNIRILRTLPISELTDEEILKAAVDRLQTKAAMLVYEDSESQKFIFLYQYKEGGSSLITRLKHAYEEKFGKLKSIDYKDVQL